MENDLEETMSKCRDELTDEHIKWIIYQIFATFKYLHSGKVAHRSIKPNEVLLNKSMVIQICGFG